MLSLKKKYRSIKSSLNSPSSSTGGSLNDLENRVVMLCEEFPVEQSLDSQNHGARSSQGSRCQGGTSESEPPVIHLSRDRLSYRKACYVEGEPNPGFSQKVVQVYGNLSSFHPKMKFFLLCGIYSAQHVHRVSFIYVFEQDICLISWNVLCVCQHVIRPRLFSWRSEHQCCVPHIFVQKHIVGILWQCALLLKDTS